MSSPWLCRSYLEERLPHCVQFASRTSVAPASGSLTHFLSLNSTRVDHRNQNPRQLDSSNTLNTVAYFNEHFCEDPMTLMGTIYEIKLDSISSSPSLFHLNLSLSISRFDEKLPLISSSLAHPRLPFLPPISSPVQGLHHGRDFWGARKCAGRVWGQQPLKYELWEPLGWPQRTQAAAEAEYTARTI